jgi:hypothetical protein
VFLLLALVAHARSNESLKNRVTLPNKFSAPICWAIVFRH